MRKEVGWRWYYSIGLALSPSRWNFQTNLFCAHPVSGLKLLSESCFYYLKTIIVSQWRYSVGGVWKKSGNLQATCLIQLILNDSNRVRWVVLGLSEDGTCTNLFENLSVNSLKGDSSNATTFNPPLLSLINTPCPRDRIVSITLV